MGERPHLRPLGLGVVRGGIEMPEQERSSTRFAGVTIHGGGDPLSYAWRCIRECDFKIPLNRLDFRLVHPPVNKPVAIGTNAAKVAGRVMLIMRAITWRHFRDPESLPSS
jgi:hypothetical protein